MAKQHHSWSGRLSGQTESGEREKKREMEYINARRKKAISDQNLISYFQTESKICNTVHLTSLSSLSY